MKGNKICEILDIQYPIIQGGMAWISDGNLAAAVSNAGGLGTIAAGNAPPDVVRGMIHTAKSLTDKPFAVNIMLMSPFVSEVVDVVIEEKIAAVTTGAGSPSAFAARFKEAGIKLIPVVPAVAIAKRMEKLGADIIICEGMEAGGHIGKLTTMALTPQIVDAVSVPVIAAGGIADGRGMAAAFMLGAQGVQIGTRFLVANECTAHENYKAKVLKAKEIDTEITGMTTGHPVRQIRNKFTKTFNEIEAEENKKEEPNMARLDELLAGSLRLAAIDGDVDNGSVMAGQISGLVMAEQTAAEIIQEIMDKYNELTTGGCC
ncbi:MAG: enoyl-[acyl-carrier-protein] reductase FabK [Defluviitaleaceae bacterium]|nr:enoyl-[acyl-carrier-protein] reductase FabK [Defluviitaleaceae bacterium]